MKILGEGYRRVNAKGEGINKKAKQSKDVKIGVLIAGVCVSSFSMFTTTPAYGEVEGIDAKVVNVGGSTDQENLNEFKDWACNDLIDQTLCDKYKDAEGWEDLDIDDIIKWKEANAIEDLVAGDFQLFSSINVRYIVEQRSLDSTININASVDSDVEYSRQANSIVELITTAGQATWEESIHWDTISDFWGQIESSTKPKIATQFRDATSKISLFFDGGSANWSSPVFWENLDVYWDAPESASTPYLAKVHTRDADSSIEVGGSIGTADYESTVFWQYMDVNWEEEDTTSQTQFFVPVHERNADASIEVNGSVGTADYDSTVFWEFMDVNWEEEDTTTEQQFFSTVHERNVSAGVSMSMTVGQAGWASDFIWEGLDINWDDEVSGQFIQGNIDASFSLFGTSSFVLADLENRTASANINVSSSITHNIIIQRNASSSSAFTMTVGSAGWASNLIWEQADVEWHLTSGQLIQEGASSSLSLSTNVSGDIDTIYQINASSSLSLSTNLNTELIQGWNSETTFVENLNRNWEAI